MADLVTATLGSLPFDGLGASIVSDVVITPPPRTVMVATNCLASEPVQLCDYYSDFGSIAFTAKLAGRDTVGETAPEHLARLWANLQAEVASDSNTFTLYIAGVATPYTYSIKKNDPLESIITPLTQSRAVMRLDVKLKYMP